MKKMILTKDEKKAIPFILPGVLVTALLIVYPLCYVIVMSFSDNAMCGGGFAGFANYTRLFKNPMFTKDDREYIKVDSGNSICFFYTGDFYAMLNKPKGLIGKRILEKCDFIAWIIPGVVKATAWKWLFTTDGGMVNEMLMQTGIIQDPYRGSQVQSLHWQPL